eukprot:TRINITY_DN4586_c0_g2_i2.p1 TRINITY_DN4586_c0_g2~~TRINITY_DN4586_c0_g2_i2.p1  ORF type:complete len:362 (-),score=64.34 TRINITY_DN4586_c0_g2_i2:166-1251(-)
MLRFASFMFLLGAVASRQLPEEGEPKRDNEIVVTLGGYSGGVSVQIIEETGSCKGEYTQPKFPNAEFSHQTGWTAAVHKLNGGKGDVILCGGKDTVESNECNMIEIGTDRWREGYCKMDFARTHAKLVSAPDGKVIISGGYNDMQGWLKDVSQLVSINPSECTTWNSNCCTWESLGASPIGVYEHCFLHYDNDHLVLIGGNTWDEQNGMYDIADIQIYNKQTGQWKMGEPMPIGRQRAGCVKTTHNGRSGIMVAGGYCHGNPNYEQCDQLRLSNTIFYDWENDSWEEIGDLKHGRDGVSLAYVGDKLYAFGGEYKGNVIVDVEVWNEEGGVSTWTETSTKLTDGIANYAFTSIPAGEYTCV